jgi:hypothetical protein
MSLKLYGGARIANRWVSSYAAMGIEHIIREWNSSLFFSLP